MHSNFNKSQSCIVCVLLRVRFGINQDARTRSFDRHFRLSVVSTWSFFATPGSAGSTLAFAICSVFAFIPVRFTDTTGFTESAWPTGIAGLTHEATEFEPKFFAIFVQIADEICVKKPRLATMAWARSAADDVLPSLESFCLEGSGFWIISISLEFSSSAMLGSETKRRGTDRKEPKRGWSAGCVNSAVYFV